MISAQKNFDVLILGGGLAGLTLARQLLMKRPDIRVAILEKRKFPAQKEGHQNQKS